MINKMEEKRGANKKLIFIHYSTENAEILENFQKGCRSRIILPPGTQFEFLSEKISK